MKSKEAYEFDDNNVEQAMEVIHNEDSIKNDESLLSNANHAEEDEDEEAFVMPTPVKMIKLGHHDDHEKGLDDSGIF